LRSKLEKILADSTGQSIEKIQKDTNRNYFMSAEEAKEYNIIDDILFTRETPFPSNGKK